MKTVIFKYIYIYYINIILMSSMCILKGGKTNYIQMCPSRWNWSACVFYKCYMEETLQYSTTPVILTSFRCYLLWPAHIQGKFLSLHQILHSEKLAIPLC